MVSPGADQELAGRFRLQRSLGRGGNAEVWLATDETSGSEVALRVLVAGSEADAATLDAGLSADAERLRRLVHPGVLRPLAVVRDGLRVAQVLEPADQGDLGDLRGASWQAIVAAIREVAEALQYVHAQGLTHGDLKAGNVLRDRQGRWRLTDFRGAGQSGSSAAVSLSSVSPQQLAGVPPTPADDIYALGALLYDLLAGQPPLHPAITPDRIRDDVPARLGVDGRGQDLPVELTQLVAAMLEKVPGLRPGSLGAVRALLTDIASDAPGAGSPAATATTSPVYRRRTDQARPAAVPLLAVGGLVALLAAVLAVVFWLPRVVTERGPLVRATPPVPAAPVPAPVAAPPVVEPRAAADAALAERVRGEAAARAAAADRWGEADWLEAQRIATLGDEQYRARDFVAAAPSYADAARRFTRLADGAAEAFAAAMQAGQAAIGQADQPAAVAAFQRALAIRPADPAAARGLARSQRLDQVLRAMAEAEARESAGDVAAARSGYGAVLALDSDWAPARSAIARLDAARAASEFERAMAAGLAALASGRTAEARQALNRALALRPGDAGARSALEQLDGAERRTRLGALEADAGRLVAAERWGEAATKYREMLAIDPTLALAQSGLPVAESRASLDERLARQLANGERFNDDGVVAAAETVLREAEAVTSPGPVLAGQVSSLRQLIAAAARPVPVQFESDNLTNVVIFKVGSLGAFTARTVALRPGTYVVVGTRDGYRDVRRNVRVAANGPTATVSVRCEEPI